MSIVELLEQAKSLSPQERDELIQKLVLMQADTGKLDTASATHWGKSVNQVLDDSEAIEMKYPEIEDPVEWVKQRRAEEQKRRLDTGENTQ